MTDTDLKPCPSPVAGWRGMESAPKDGTEVLVYSCGDVFTAKYHKSNVSNDDPFFATTVCGELWDCSNSDYRIEHEYRRGISHWRPLPPSPTDQPVAEQPSVAEAARVLLGDDIALSKMAAAMHDGPLMADDYAYSAATPAGSWCLDMARAALRTLSQEDAQ